MGYPKLAQTFCQHVHTVYDTSLLIVNVLYYDIYLKLQVMPSISPLATQILMSILYSYTIPKYVLSRHWQATV